ncbi:unnamed protein product [Rotaria socialis]
MDTDSDRMLTTINENNSSDHIVENKRRRKKCHGNRKVQRFRKKCRARGMKLHNIEKKIKQKFVDSRTNQTKSMVNNNDSIDNRPKTIITLKQHVNKESNISNKRKREPVRSLSQISISQPISKKVKKKQNIIRTTIPNSDKVYRVASYLKRLPRLLIQALGRQLDQPLKTKLEHRFIYSRLKLLDLQYCLNIHESLWHSYFDLGCEQQQWPDDFYKIAKTHDPQLCQQFVQEYLTHIQNQLEQCSTNLHLQVLTCPETLNMTLLDQYLKEYICSQQKRFIRKIHHQLKQFKDTIHEKRLHHILFGNNLTSDQKEAIHRIIHIRETELQIRKELLMFEERILSKLLPVTFDRFDPLIGSDFYTPTLDDHHSFNYKLKRSKILQEMKRTCLNIIMESYEVKMKECNRQYQEELKQLEYDISTHQHDVRVLFRTVQAYIKHRTMQMKKDIFEQMNTFHGKLTRHRQRCKKVKETIGVSPEVIFNVNDHSLAMIEHEYLSRNGNYIRPNRTALRSYKERTKIIQQQHEIMVNRTKLQLSQKCHIHAKSIIFKQFSERLLACLMFHYMNPLPFIEHVCAQRDLKTMKSIRRKLKKNQLLLRETDKGGNLYVGHINEFDEKSAEYRKKTGAYEELSSSPIEDILSKVTRLLNDLHVKTKQLSLQQYKKMIPNRLTVELAYMYYNPKTHKNPITLRPIMNTIHAATTGISRFLDQSIRPLFDMHAQPRPIIDGGHLLRQLEQYVHDGHLKPTTLFCTADITNLYTMLPQDESLDILEEFLREHNYEQIQGISIGVIRQLAHLVLKETAFVDGNKFYRQIIGGAMGSPFTLTLANIFMWKWEKNAICSALESHEIYGRYIDDIFFTFNGPKPKIQRIIEKANEFHPNIKLEANIGSCVSVLDLLIENRNGVLFTSLYHKPAAEPCVVPFISDHARHVFSNIIKASLLRAVRYSSTLDIFEKERRTIRLMLLYNGYIDKNFRKFFTISISQISMIPFMNNEDQFLTMKRKLLAQPSVKERQTQDRIDKATTEKDINYNNIEERKTNITIVSKQSKPNKHTHTIFLHYTHEKRLSNLKRDIHKIYSELFQGTPAMKMRLIVGHRNHRNIGNELIQKRPHSSLLKPPQLASMIFLI